MTINSVADLRNADHELLDLEEARLRDADLRGADLESANLEKADLGSADLRGADLEKANFKGACLEGVDLRGANLRGANLKWADLSRAILRGAQLDDDVPVVPDIHRAVLRAVGPDGEALNMREWHSDCGTTHCRAGWAITLAGEAGRELEERVGPSAAAALIYQASDPGLDRIPDWAAGDDEALADMRRLAG